jgi:ribonuclease T1
MTLRNMTRLIIPILLISFLLQTLVYAESCEKMVNAVNAGLSPKIDRQELVNILRSLNSSNNKKLPPEFVTKKEAKSLGWKPGKSLWSINLLKGASIGGDRFNNREARLPEKKWREADLDYKGGHRGGKRLIFSRDGSRFVTVDHYRTFVEVPACR